MHNAYANVTEYRVQGGAISPAIFWRFSLCWTVSDTEVKKKERGWAIYLVGCLVRYPGAGQRTNRYDQRSSIMAVVIFQAQICKTFMQLTLSMNNLCQLGICFTPCGERRARALNLPSGDPEDQLRDWAADSEGQAGDETELQDPSARHWRVRQVKLPYLYFKQVHLLFLYLYLYFRQVHLHEEPQGGPWLGLLYEGETRRPWSEFEFGNLHGL